MTDAEATKGQIKMNGNSFMDKQVKFIFKILELVK